MTTSTRLLAALGALILVLVGAGYMTDRIRDAEARAALANHTRDSLRVELVNAWAHATTEADNAVTGGDLFKAHAETTVGKIDEYLAHRAEQYAIAQGEKLADQQGETAPVIPDLELPALASTPCDSLLVEARAKLIEGKLAVDSLEGALASLRAVAKEAMKQADDEHQRADRLEHQGDGFWAHAKAIVRDAGFVAIGVGIGAVVVR